MNQRPPDPRALVLTQPTAHEVARRRLPERTGPAGRGEGVGLAVSQRHRGCGRRARRRRTRRWVAYRGAADGSMRGVTAQAGARAPPHSPRPCGSPVRHRQSADGPAHRARERTRGSLRHAIPTLLPMLREWYRVSRSSRPQRGFPSAPLAASSASRFRSPARMFPMSWFPSWQAYSYRRWSLRAMGMDTVQGFVQTVGSVIVHS